MGGFYDYAIARVLKKNLLVLGRIGGYGMCFCVLSSVRLQAVSDPATRWKYQLKLLKNSNPIESLFLVEKAR